MSLMLNCRVGSHVGTATKEVANLLCLEVLLFAGASMRRLCSRGNSFCVILEIFHRQLSVHQPNS